MFDLKNRIPKPGHVVICHRKWTPTHIGNDGKEMRKKVLAIRTSSMPCAITDDISLNCWWEGVNEIKGRNWSDSTVEGWSEIKF